MSIIVPRIPADSRYLIGGITYVSAWNPALAENATQLGLNAAEAARTLGVGIEIDYEESRRPDTTGVQAFIDAYRSVNAYDATGAFHPSRLTIDLAAGDRWLIDLATRNFVQGVLPNGAGTTAGMLGFMFWAAERPSSRGIGTVPPNSCEKGVGTGATAMGIQIPMPVLRVQ